MTPSAQRGIHPFPAVRFGKPELPRRPAKAFATVASSDNYDAILNKAAWFLNVHPSRTVCKLNLSPDGAALHASAQRKSAALPTHKRSWPKSRKPPCKAAFWTMACDRPERCGACWANAINLVGGTRIEL